MKKNVKVAIALSVFNPNLLYLKKQIESLINQNFEADIYIRDDGSTSKTHYPYLNEINNVYHNVYINYGDNCGVFASFMKLIKFIVEKKTYDIIGFSTRMTLLWRIKFYLQLRN